MRVSYDAEVDILTIVFRSEKVKESEKVLPGVIVDLDDDDRITAFEIMDASRSTDLSEVNVAVSQPTHAK